MFGIVRSSSQFVFNPVLRTAYCVFVFGPVLCSLTATSLEERWHVDIGPGARSLPTVVDRDGDGNQEVLLTSRFDGTIWCIDSKGAVTSRYRRSNWLEGSIAASDPIGGRARLFAFQESSGTLSLADFSTGLNLVVDVPGDPCIGSAPCFGDLNRSGRQEIICARRNGILCALDRRLSALWEYDARSPFDSIPVVAPVFMGASAVYAQSTNGVVHCIDGEGLPLWRFTPPNRASEFPQFGDLLVVELNAATPLVLASDSAGWMYALDAVTGQERWRSHAGTTALGSPAVLDVRGSGNPEIVTVSAAGEIAVIGASGELLAHHTLPEGTYVPRPLVADVNGDGDPEIVVAARDWRIVVASLSGMVKEELPVRGNVLEGLVLADLDGDGPLELLAVTDCARVHCFATRARFGWTHPRGSVGLGGWVPPITPVYQKVSKPGNRRPPRRLRVTVPELNRDHPFASAVIELHRSYRKRNLVAVLRRRDRIIGSTVAPAKEGSIAIPYYRDNPLPLSLTLALQNPAGETIKRYEPIPIHTSRAIPVLLPSRSEFIAALAKRGKKFGVPDAWRLPEVGGKNSWAVATYMPDRWKRFGLADEPFIQNAIPRINAPATEPSRMFSPAHPAWDAMKHSDVPFFLMNGYFQPAGRYPDDVYEAIVDMADTRFLGFPVHEWGYRIWKEQLEGATKEPDDRKEAMEVFHKDFKRLLDQTHGRIYAGEGYCMVHHQAYAWGAPMCYAEIGENIPWVPLQMAFLRGAARQYGYKPWGAYISNWFRGSVLDTRYRDPSEPRLQWSPPDLATGPTCGHSPSLEFRMAMAAHLAGATFVHHESDAFHDSVFVREYPQGTFSLSAHGEAYKRWYDYSTQYMRRGVPYTPIAFMVAFDQGWRPREQIFGIWPPDRRATSLEHIFRHVYDWQGRLDFERGYLSNGPYGDVFDVLTDDAGLENIRNYGVLWPLGDIITTPRQRRELENYVKDGGVLVLDSAHAVEFTHSFLGMTIAARPLHATGIQTALQSIPAVTTPFPYRQLKLGDDARALAWTESGAPLVAWHGVGKGMVIVSATDHWLDAGNELVPIVGALLRTLVDAFVPVHSTADVETLINRTENGFIIGLINNHGVSKVPTEAALIDSRGERECVITFDTGAPLRFVSRMGEFRWSAPANGLLTRIPPGQVAVVEVITEGP